MTPDLRCGAGCSTDARLEVTLPAVIRAAAVQLGTEAAATDLAVAFVSAAYGTDAAPARGSILISGRGVPRQNRGGSPRSAHRRLERISSSCSDELEILSG